MPIGGLKEWCLMNDISFTEVKKKLDDAPEGYVPRECYDAVLQRANKLDDICRYLRKENRELKATAIQVTKAIQALNKIVGEKGLVKHDKD